LTQKVGNSRIFLEDVNGNAKQTGGYFNTPIALTQLGFAPILMRVCFLMQNFRPAYIHGVYVDDPESWQGRESRPCRGEIRWYGATDAGLVDVRGAVDLWGLTQERKRFAELQKLHPEKPLEEIGEIVLSEDWPTKCRQKLHDELKIN